MSIMMKVAIEISQIVSKILKNAEIQPKVNPVHNKNVHEAYRIFRSIFQLLQPIPIFKFLQSIFQKFFN